MSLGYFGGILNILTVLEHSAESGTPIYVTTGSAIYRINPSFLIVESSGRVEIRIRNVARLDLFTAIWVAAPIVSIIIWEQDWTKVFGGWCFHQHLPGLDIAKNLPCGIASLQDAPLIFPA